jgi:hypothetical protein
MVYNWYECGALTKWQLTGGELKYFENNLVSATDSTSTALGSNLGLCSEGKEITEIGMWSS